ncbi:MAG: phosphonate C-P lyase system protein PhnG [Pigmentiphaga sp.]|uniref:phosphonate C-P lyase system protein PhnG n=1 Tax=Pigmentiphaga sp. TaxID=1977564 RepID=UPI0029A7B270|nr:phosphonate C-P lyase system protein PhnG [Pigmentiphaga sp.]MDX3904892.1 phosphonate C-P lyase system protein PhnG [Pigmentiphaga sp.]
MTTLPEFPRHQWLRLWSALPADRVKAAAGTLAARYRIDDLELPQSGLGLLPLADGALGQAYFLGEIPLARAHVRISDDQGHAAEGAAAVMDDRASLARALAVLDGIVAARLPGHEDARQLLAEGADEVARTEAERRKLLIATGVDFSILGTQSGEDDDA